jgi:GNAT superfamily N-acetyltransferase
VITVRREYDRQRAETYVFEDEDGTYAQVLIANPRGLWFEFDANQEWENDAEIEEWLTRSKAKEVAYLASIRVPVDLRGQGRGTEMLMHVLKTVDDMRLPHTLLHALAQPLGPSTPELSNWYSRFGFRVLADGERQYRMSAVTMVRARPTSSRRVR